MNQKSKRARRAPKRNGKQAADAAAGPAVFVQERPPKREPCVTVAIGASAGGLEAFTELLRAMPKNPGLAFVLIPHLDPKHESAMSDLLGRATPMQVRQVRDGMRVQVDCVYVIPPNRVMTIHEGVLKLAERAQSGLNMPIDAFFQSLAEDCRGNAIGVILSGTASDGTRGIEAIKSEGGITFAQEPKTAKYDSMPVSAIASGNVDFILPPRDIARELLRISRHPFVTRPESPATERPAVDDGSRLSEIFQILRQARNVDFSHYKPATIRRRILRRMALVRVETLNEYVELMRKNPQEVDSLHNDILINVTSFFRDPEAFEALQEVVYPAMMHARRHGNTIRIWVPGCSTGEEAYSHAMSLMEFISKARIEVPVQVFGTDLSELAIRAARSGIYKEGIAADVSPARLRRFFRKVENGYQISKSIRDMCVFATQNVFDDPPFSRMDLVSCRNVLIYLSPVLQRRVVPIFHYALNPTGYLMVGNTEGLVGLGAELFEAADKRHKIYRKKPVPSPVAFGMVPQRFDARIPNAADNVTAAREQDSLRTPIELQREADRLLLTKYVPAAVVINEQNEILQTRGRANRYLELPSGKATLNLLKMAKPGLLFELQNSLEEVRKSGSELRKENVQFQVDGGVANVHLEIIPFHAPLESSSSYVIIFEEGPAPAKLPEPPSPPLSPDDKDRQIGQLKQELAATKDYLQSIIEALEASNQELQSANEEIQSGSEELQSTNEELQTSKEELESANEELNTLNEEMQHRNMELTQINNDLLNLLSSVNIPIVMLDANLSIRRITPQADEVLGITSADVGRPIRNMRLRLDVPDLEDQMLDVIAELRPRELQIRNAQKNRFRLRITPYRTMDNRIEGVVLAFIDVDGVLTKSSAAGSRTRDGKSKARTGK